MATNLSMYVQRKKNVVQLAKDIAADPSHGYDQANRLGPDYDCSSFIAYVLAENGFRVARSSWTGNLYGQLAADGFEACTPPWRPMDIHLTPGKHVAMSVDADNIVHARINELGKTTGGQTGDQTGNEIAVTPYYDYPWTYHLRWHRPGTETIDEYWQIAEEVIQGKYRNYPERQQILEAMGYDYAEVQEHVNAIYIAKDVVKGRYGNGEERMKKLMELGYDYCLVQDYVNKMLGVING